GCSEIVAHFLLTSGSADFSKAEDDQKTIRSSVFCCVLNAASASQQPFPALQTHLSCIRQ
ncbi:hypothetical protein, partial [Pseudomonas gessardii]|uniref:hypothetical protein n=1 Tax=Pseudomonas gessardii TaxID=78544 RepID=UPI001CA3C782